VSVHSSNPTWPMPGRTHASRSATAALTNALGLEALARSDEACLVLDRDGVIRFANAAASRIAGMNVEPQIGRPAVDVLPRFLTTRFAQVCRRALITGRVVAAEAPDLEGEGWYELRCVPLEEGIALFARDIAERKRRQQGADLVATAATTLNSSLDLRATLAGLSSVVVPAFADMCFVDLIDGNGTLRRVAALHRDPVMTATLRRFYERVPLADRDRHPSHNVVETGITLFVRSMSAETLVAMTSGGEERDLVLRVRPRSVIIAPLTAAGIITGTVSFGRTIDRETFDDIDRHTAEELAAHVGMAVQNARLHEAESAARRTSERMLARLGKLQRATASLSRALPREEVLDVIIGETLIALGATAGGVVELSEDGREFVLLRSRGMPESTVSRFARYPVDLSVPTREVARTHEAVFLPNAAAWRRDFEHGPGTAADGAWAAVPLLAEDRLLGVLTLTFPTARRFSAEDREFVAAFAAQCAQALARARLFDAAQQARAAAESANQAKSQFLAVMSHELRTPLTAVMGYAEMLESGIAGDLNPRQLQHLTRIRTSAGHLRDLINDVLSLTRIEAGREDVARGTVELAAIARDAVGWLRPEAAQKSIGIRVELPDQQYYVETDAPKLRQILVNLLSNAVKFTDDGGVALRLSATEGEDYTFIVSDTGPGIAIEDQQRIFEPFMQLDLSNTREKNGSGLGLTVSRRLARLLGGDLHVHSMPGEGSTFSLRLPWRMPRAL
jgi:PAS domain S-box-containing protein